jgi:hypothetical protein
LWVAGLAILLAASVAVDAVTGGSRVAALTNTVIPNAAGQPVNAYVAIRRKATAPSPP